MNINLTLLVQIATAGIAVGAVANPVIDFTKSFAPNANSKLIKVVSVAISAGLGYLIPLYFFNAQPVDAAWTALFSVAGAEAIYQNLRKGDSE